VSSLGRWQATRLRRRHLWTTGILLPEFGSIPQVGTRLSTARSTFPRRVCLGSSLGSGKEGKRQADADSDASGLDVKICTSCRTAATSTCFPASSTRHRSRRLMRIGRHREGSAVPAGRARQGDSRKIPIKATSWPSPVRPLRFGVTISLTTRVLISAGRKATTKPTAKTTEPVARTPSWTHLLQLDQRLLPRHAYADEEECVELSAQPSLWCRWPPADDSR
jgi:hypothetical protein